MEIFELAVVLDGMYLITSDILFHNFKSLKNHLAFDCRAKWLAFYPLDQLDHVSQINHNRNNLTDYRLQLDFHFLIIYFDTPDRNILKIMVLKIFL